MFNYTEMMDGLDNGNYQSWLPWTKWGR